MRADRESRLHRLQNVVTAFERCYELACAGQWTAALEWQKKGESALDQYRKGELLALAEGALLVMPNGNVQEL